MDKRRFMSDEFGTSFHLIFEVTVHIVFKILTRVQVYAVPELWLATVHIVD